MKKIILLFALFVAFGCSDENQPTTYQVQNSVPKFNSGVDPLFDGSLYEVVVFCYNEKGEVVHQDNITKIAPEGGISEILEVTPDIVKVRISFKYMPPESIFYDNPANSRNYVKVTHYLTPEANTIVSLDGNTMVGHTLD